jgi:hypothetical protein
VSETDVSVTIESDPSFLKVTLSKDHESQRIQLAEQRRRVDFDTYDITIDELIRRVAKSRIDVAPAYQRQFRWDESRQSALVESLFLGIPVPPLFMATNGNAGEELQWEVVDGLQRLLTLVNFIADKPVRGKVRLDGTSLALKGLEKLPTFNGYTFDALPADIRSNFEDRPLKVVVLNDKSDLTVRYDLFERLNTGGVALTDQEVRECVFRGPLMDLLSELADTKPFKTVVALPESKWKDGTPQDYVLRYFAFCDRYLSFNHSVKEFLKDFTRDNYQTTNIAYLRDSFAEVFDFLASVFPNSIKTRKGMTPVNLFEAIVVGARLALNSKPKIRTRTKANPAWVTSKDLRKLTTGATNSNPRVRGRIEYCRDRFLNV